MPDNKISNLNELAVAPDAGDLFVIVDVSDTSMSASGTTKKIQSSNVISDASTTVKGKVELATDAETITGTDTIRAVTPSNITAKIDTDGTLAGNLDTRIPSQKAVKTYADTKTTLSAVYPIGSIYISTVSTNPATLFGFGTWSAFAAGRTLIGVGTSDQTFAAAATGGESNHTLVRSEMPNITAGFTLHGSGGTGCAVSGISGDFSGSVETNKYHTNSSASGANSYGAVNINVGGGGSHNNLQPYIVTYMWTRTA